MPESAFPQCRIVPLRLLSPQTTEGLLSQVAGVTGIRRIVLNGPGLPVVIPYGPARGQANPNTNRRTIQVCGAEFEMKIQTGTVTLEVEDETVIATVQAVCDEFFTEIPYTLQKGRFMKSSPTLVDYAKYGPETNELVIGLVDPRKKDGPIIIPIPARHEQGEDCQEISRQNIHQI